MEIFDSSYYRINKQLLNLTGLWPYLSRTRKNISLVIFTAVTFSLVIPIFAGLLIAWGKDIEKVIESSAGTLYFLAIYSKYLSAYLFEDRIKLVYEQTARDWQSLNEKEELNILHRHSQEGRWLTITYVLYSAFAVLVFNGVPFIPLALDALFPANESYSRIYPYQPHYFIIDGTKYYYELFLFHGLTVVILTTVALTAVDCMMVVNIKHVCGLFAIVCYRLENIGQPKHPESEFNLISDVEVYHSTKKVCDMHINSLKSMARIQDSFSLSFLVIVVFGSITIGLLIFNFTFCLHDPLKFTIFFILLIGIHVCIFYMNWIVQKVIDSSEEVFMAAYSSHWYNFSGNARKLIFVILENSLKPCSLTAGSICELNLTNFVVILKASISYATVMFSINLKER